MDNIKDYKKIVPIRYHNVSFETDVSDKVKEILTNQMKKREGIYIYGPAGTGKTHLACALAQEILKNNINVMFINTSEFLEKLRQEFNDLDSEKESLLKEAMNFNGVLIIDDIGAEKASDWTRERLYLIINKRYEDMKPIIFTSNCDMDELEIKLGDRIASRIDGMVERIQKNGEDKRQK